jgi:hypothetical protein
LNPPRRTPYEVRPNAFVLSGGPLTDFGEKQSSRRLEMYARYYF